MDRAAGHATGQPAPQLDFALMFGQMMIQMQQLINTMSRSNANGIPPRTQEDFSVAQNSPSSSDRTSVSTASPANAVSLLALQILEFAGEAAENVRQ